MTKKAGNLPGEYSAYQRRCAIAARNIPLPPAAPWQGQYRISWASLDPKEQALWLAILDAADKEGVLCSWAERFLATVRRSGDDALSGEDAFGVEQLMRYAVGALRIAEAGQ